MLHKTPRSLSHVCIALCLVTLALLTTLHPTQHRAWAIIPPPPPLGVPPPPVKPLPPVGPPLKPLPLSLNSGGTSAHPQQQHVLATFNHNPSPTLTTAGHPGGGVGGSDHRGNHAQGLALPPTVTMTEVSSAQAAALAASLEPIQATPLSHAHPSSSSFTTLQFPPPLGGPGLGAPGLGAPGGFGGPGGGFGGGANNNNNNALLSSLDSALNTISQLLGQLNQNGSLNGGGINPALATGANGQPVNIPISGSNGVSVGDSLVNLQPINAGTPNLPVPDF